MIMKCSWFFCLNTFSHFLLILMFMILTRLSNSYNLKTPVCKTGTFQASYFNRIVKLWNYTCKFSPLPVFQLLLPSATLLLSTCFTFCTITLTYPIPVPGQLYDPAPAIPSLASFGWSCFNYYLYHGRCLAWVLASRSHLPFWPYHFKSLCTYISFFFLAV